MEMGILGPLLLTDRHLNLVPSAPKPRQLLAYFMLNANTMVRASECIEELWGTSPPKSAMSTLQTYVAQIRRVLRRAEDGDPDQILVTRNPGYQLSTAPDDYDRLRFEKLVGQGRRAVAEGHDDQASSLFAGALAQWRGAALEDVRVGALSSAHVIELEESRAVVVEQRIEADLRLGRHSEVLPELGRLATLHPTHENLQAQLMIALYRCGRPDQALAVFDTLQSTLVDTVGIGPAPRIRLLRDAVVDQAPELDWWNGGSVDFGDRHLATESGLRC